MTATYDYLKRVIQDGRPLKNRDWYILAFAIPRLKDTPENKRPTESLSLYTMEDGLYFVEDTTDGLAYNKLTDYSRNSPLLAFTDEVEIDNSWISTINNPTKVKIGNLILNKFLFQDVVGDKVDYYPGRINIDYVNKILIERVVDDDKVEGNFISTKDMIQIYDRLTFLSALSNITNISATPKTITPPEGLEEAKKKLLKEYEGQLDDGVKAVEFETKLMELDKQYLADDPAASVIFGGKQKGARKKMFLSYGQASDFNEDTTMISQSLDEGLSTDEDKFPAYMDDLRYGSYSRGGSTAKSGYIYKILQRSLSSITISQTPCTTTKGILREIDKSNYTKIINRYIRTSSGWKEIISMEEAEKYIGKTIEVRSTMYCKTTGNSVCYACLSSFYKGNESGISNLAANISDAFMTLFLKRMHASSTSATDIVLEHLTQ